MHECTEERFLEDIDSHEMTIIRDAGVNRHIRFKVPNTINMSFDLITWPGHLCYTGDMGTYVFSRIEDMFQFFRGASKGHEGLYINTGYWAEKCLAAGTNGVLSEYNAENAKQIIQDMLDDSEAPQITVDEINNNIIGYADDDEGAIRSAISDMEHDEEGIFNDFWETNLHIRPYRYVWCCYALSWGISIYDRSEKILSEDK